MIALYIASPEPYAGKTLTCVALGKYWKSQGRRVGYIKPLGVLPATAESQLSDEDARLVAGEIGLDAPISQLCPVVMGRQTCPSDSELARRQVQEAVQRLDSPRGGLMIFAAFCDGITPLENIEAVLCAFEEFCLKGRK